MHVQQIAISKSGTPVSKHLQLSTALLLVTTLPGYGCTLKYLATLL